MGKLIFNAQSTPVAPVGENKHTMFVDNADGKLKMEDCNGCVNVVSCANDLPTIPTDNCAFSNGCGYFKGFGSCQCIYSLSGGEPSYTNVDVYLCGACCVINEPGLLIVYPNATANGETRLCNITDGYYWSGNEYIIMPAEKGKTYQVWIRYRNSATCKTLYLFPFSC